MYLGRQGLMKTRGKNAVDLSTSFDDFKNPTQTELDLFKFETGYDDYRILVLKSSMYSQNVMKFIGKRGTRCDHKLIYEELDNYSDILRRSQASAAIYNNKQINDLIFESGNRVVKIGWLEGQLLPSELYPKENRG